MERDVPLRSSAEVTDTSDYQRFTDTSDSDTSDWTPAIFGEAQLDEWAMPLVRKADRRRFHQALSLPWR